MTRLDLHTHAERPELARSLPELMAGLWPEFVLHGAVAERHDHHTSSTFAAYSLYLCAGGEVVAAGKTVPLFWDGTAQGLPGGWDGALERGVRDHLAGRAPNTLCALGAMVSRRHQGQGLSSQILGAMRALAGKHRLGALIAPVRPTRKAEYPLTPMGRYASWRRADGLPFDPWLRTHERVGGRFRRVAEDSMTVTGTVREWEGWAGMPFPDPGEYVVPGALCPVTIDLDRDEGRYVEPNVWMVHKPLPD
ncbi:hypothetical protein [Deinococcus aetherius]|uniref:hypothetical protein n=1 Tax=Deinococcus aetherius TaxID=200252 RepID=UPI0022328D07|nr:hypothetical protein [Deinococcus aetherius]